MHHSLTALDEHFEGVVKKITLDCHSKVEKDFLDRFRSGAVAMYTGDTDRHFNAHIAEFIGVVNADTLVFVELHRSRDLVARTLDDLPTFDCLPVRITSITHKPFLALVRSLRLIEHFRLEFCEASPRRTLLPIKGEESWGIMATVHFRLSGTDKQMALLVVGNCSSMDVLAFFARQNVSVHQIINSE